jgi:glutaredoxin 3
MMTAVEIYTTTICPYCVRAKALFQKKGVAYREINIETDEALRDAMMARSGGRRTVPQIFVGDRHIGGCDDLYALERQGGLDPLLGLAE